MQNWLPQSSFVYPWAPGLKTYVQPKSSVRKKNPTRPLLVTKPKCEPQMVLSVQRVLPPGKGAEQVKSTVSRAAEVCGGWWWGGLVSRPPEGCLSAGWWCFPSPPLPGGRHYSWKPSMGASGCWKINCCCVSSTWGARLLSSSSTPK